MTAAADQRGGNETWYSPLRRAASGDIVPRQRLFERIDSGRAHRIVWLCGPAGCGKTALAASYLVARGLRSIWYPLDPADSDPVRFTARLRGGCAALIDPAALPAFPVDDGDDLEGYGRRFFSALARQLPEGAMLVLDGYHQLAADSLVHRFLAGGIDRMPRGCWLIASRSPPHDALAACLADGDIEVIASDELRLTLEESRALLGLRSDAPLTEREILEWHCRADGWPTGLMLLQYRQCLAPHLPVSDLPVFDYFIARVLSRPAGGRQADGDPGASAATGTDPSWSVRIHALGLLQVEVQGRPLEFSVRAQCKPLELLRRLIAHGGDHVLPRVLAEELWPEAEGDRAMAALKTTLQRLRHLLGHGALIQREGRISLNAREVWLDAWSFEHALRESRCQGDISGLERALVLYLGPLLADDGDDARDIPLRHRLQTAYVSGVESLCELLIADRREIAAMQWYRAALAVEPLSETLTRRHIALCLRLGFHCDALQSYRNYERQLGARYGLKPGPELMLLINPLLRPVPAETDPV